jgi:hypothetical protein
LVKHHKGEAAVTIKRMLVMKVNNRLLFPVLKPVVARNPAIMRIGPAIMFQPTVKFTVKNANPRNE